MIDKIAPEATAELHELRQRIKAIDPSCDVFLVGGYLRDVIIRGEARGDYDFVTNLHPDKAVQLGFNRVGEAFPVFLTDRGSELALTRTERKTGTGYNGFSTEFTPSFREDALRRDLTINTVLWNPDVGLVFPVEAALEDFARQELNACTEAFAEDPLRVFRAARFAQRFGWHVGSWTRQLCDRVAGEACSLDFNRVRDEIDKVLAMRKGLHIFYSYLPHIVADYWLGEGYLPRSTCNRYTKKISWSRFHEATFGYHNSELDWAWFAMGSKDPEKLLRRFGKGDSTQAVLRILQLIDRMGEDHPDLESIFKLWTSIRRGVVPQATWRHVISKLHHESISEILDIYDVVPTLPFSNADERQRHYISEAQAELDRRTFGDHS